MALEYHLNIKDSASATINNVSQKVNALSLTFNKFDTRINTTNNYFTKLTQNINNGVNQSLSKMGTAFAGFVSIGMAKGVAALKDFAKEMLQSYDSAVKLSDNIGVAADSIIGLRYAADMSNVGAENMDKNMAKLAQTISKAASGSKDAAGTFAKMGIEVKNSDGTLKNSEQVLMEMADAFQQLPAGTERATLAMDVFGKSGASMVTMLKDGSGALREMTNDGKAAAGDIESISKLMGELSSAGTMAKSAITGMMASLSNNFIFDSAIYGLRELSQAFLDWRKVSSGEKEEKRIKDIEGLAKATKEYQVKLKEVEKKELEVRDLIEARDSNGFFKNLFSAKPEELKEYEKMQKELEKTNEMKIKLDLDLMGGTTDDVTRLTAQLEGLKQARKELGGYSKNDMEQWEIDSLESYIGKLKEAAKAEDDDKKKTAAAVAGYADKEAAAKKAAEAAKKAAEAAKKAAEEARRLEEQRLKDEAKEFDDLMKKKGKAIEDLAELDEKMRIAGFDGERKKIEQALSDYEKQKQKLEELHDMELMFAADDEKFEILANQGERLADLKRQSETELDKISKEYADKRMKNDQALAKFDEETRNKKLSGFALEQSQLEANFEKRRQDMQKLHEEELALAEDKEAAQKAQHDRMLALETAFNEERKAMSRATVVQSATDSLGALQQMAEGYKSYAGLYKASQIGQATINAVQSVLKTMASVPYPLNIPMAALQGAAAAVQVRKIASTKMYTGGMIPGGSQYLRVNEEGPEAILNTGAVRAVGGPAGVNALNRGDSIYHNNNSRTSSINVTFNAAFLDAKGYNDVFKPMLKEHERRL